MGAFDNAWNVLKARTERDQSGSMKDPGRRGKFNQPKTAGAMTSRIPLVGAQNPKATTDERTPYRATPGANRKREAAFAQRQIAEGMQPDEDIMEYTPEDLAAMREHALMQVQNPTFLTDLKNRQISGPGNATMSDVHSMANEYNR
tara:strand:- start:258 stop:695 length:438 start_codon:yes stop_codon:yes gene_type:complete